MARKTTTLTPDDLAFVAQHALDWARGADRGRAYRYQVWYLRTYAKDARSMEDFPAHPHVWPQFLRQDAR